MSAPPKFLTSTITVTAAQILALATTPLQLAPTPGPGNSIIFSATAIHYKHGTTPFTLTGSPYFAMAPNPLSGQYASYMYCAGSIDQTTDTWNYAATFGLYPAQAPTTDNLPLLLLIQGGAATLGDGTLSITTLYLVAPTP